MPDCSIEELALQAAQALVSETALLLSEAETLHYDAVNGYQDALIALETCQNSSPRAASAVKAPVPANAVRHIRQSLQHLNQTN